MEKPNTIDKKPSSSKDYKKDNHIPFLGGRPQRDTIISLDEITDLRINLNITKSVEEFLFLI